MAPASDVFPDGGTSYAPPSWVRILGPVGGGIAGCRVTRTPRAGRGDSSAVQTRPGWHRLTVGPRPGSIAGTAGWAGLPWPRPGPRPTSPVGLGRYCRARPSGGRRPAPRRRGSAVAGSADPAGSRRLGVPWPDRSPARYRRRDGLTSGKRRAIGLGQGPHDDHDGQHEDAQQERGHQPIAGISSAASHRRGPRLRAGRCPPAPCELDRPPPR